MTADLDAIRTRHLVGGTGDLAADLAQARADVGTLLAECEVLAAKVERVRALADEWARGSGDPRYYDNLRWGRAAASRLLAALDGEGDQ